MLEKKPLRVSFVQPALPHYRFPLFENLSTIAGFEVTVWAPVEKARKDFHEITQGGSFITREGVVTRLGPFFLQPASIRAAWVSDILVLSLNIRFVDIFLAVLVARSRRCPIIFWGHGRTRPDVNWSTWIRDRVARLGDTYVFYNQAEATDFQKRVHYNGRVVVVHNPLDTDTSLSALAVEAHRNHAVKTKVLVIARLFKAKRIDLLVQALKLLARDLRHVELAIVGDGPERERLQRMSHHHGLADRIMFHGAVHNDSEIAFIAQNCAVLCLPSAAGLSVLHGMAHGVPVLLNDNASANGPEYESLMPGTNGLTFRQDDVRDLAEKISLFVTDAPLQQKLAGGAIATIQTGMYTTRAAAATFHDAIIQVRKN